MARTFREWGYNAVYAVRVPIARYFDGEIRTVIGVVRSEVKALRFIARDFVDVVMNVVSR